MIERMINKAENFLPLKISEVFWDGAFFRMSSKNWGFASLSNWRISKNNIINFGSGDEHSEDLIKIIIGTEIIEIKTQDTLLKIDPIFVLSNGLKLDFFSANMFEPWTFSIAGLGFYESTPGEPHIFDINDYDV